VDQPGSGPDVDIPHGAGHRACVAPSVWKRAWSTVRGWCGSPGSESREAGVAAPPGYLQLQLALYNRDGLAMRIHLRFAEGDNSYNYLRSGQAHIGLFQDQALARRAKAFVRRESKRLSSVLDPVTLAEARLRAEDSAAFMGQLLKGEPMTTELQEPESAGKLSIACSEPRGAAWRGEFEFKSSDELNAEHGPLIAACMQIGDAAVAAAKTPG
jgi:hypothetical protein